MSAVRKQKTNSVMYKLCFAVVIISLIGGGLLYVDSQETLDEGTRWNSASESGTGELLKTAIPTDNIEPANNNLNASARNKSQPVARAARPLSTASGPVLEPVAYAKHIYPDTQVLGNPQSGPGFFINIRRLFTFTELFRQDLENASYWVGEVCSPNFYNTHYPVIARNTIKQSCSYYQDREKQLVAAIDHLTSLQTQFSSIEYNGKSDAENTIYNDYYYPQFLASLEKPKNSESHDERSRAVYNTFIEKHNYPYPENTFTVVADVLRVREKPTTKSAHIASLRVDDVVAILGKETASGWVEVAARQSGYLFLQSRGYVKRDYLAELSEAQRLPDIRRDMENTRDASSKLRLAERAFSIAMTPDHAKQLIKAQRNAKLGSRAEQSEKFLSPHAETPLFYCRGDEPIWLEESPYLESEFMDHKPGSEEHRKLLERFRVIYQGYPWFSEQHKTRSDFNNFMPDNGKWQYRMQIEKLNQPSNPGPATSYFKLNMDAACLKNAEKDFFAATPIRRHTLQEFPIDADLMQFLKLWQTHNVLDVRMYKFPELPEYTIFVAAPVPVNMQYWGGRSYAEGARAMTIVNVNTREQVYSIGSMDYEGPVYVNDIKAVTRRLQGDTRIVVEWTDADDGTTDGNYLDHLKLSGNGNVRKLDRVTLRQSAPEGTDCEYPLCEQLRR